MPRHRIIEILENNKAESPVCSSPVVTVTLEQMDMVGSHYPEALYNPHLMGKLAEAAHTIIGFEGMRIPFDLCVEAEAFGCEIKAPSRDTPPSVIGPAFKAPDQFHIPWDVFQKGRFNTILEAVSWLKGRYEDKTPIYVGITGPFTLAGHLCNVNKLLRLIIKNPDELRRILDSVADFCTEYANKLLKAGGDVVVVIDPTASGDLISEKSFETFLCPVYQKMHKKIAGNVILHICGNTRRLLSLIPDTGFEGFSFEGPAVDVKTAKKALGSRTALVGNIPTRTLLLGTPEQVKHEVKVALEDGIEILAPACGIPMHAPTQNLKAMVSTVKEYHRQPGCG
jgi:[methyl-Co(III) methanol-specific corrinoid protein]:coenzyme M methyltransferase